MRVSPTRRPQGADTPRDPASRRGGEGGAPSGERPPDGRTSTFVVETRTTEEFLGFLEDRQGGEAGSRAASRYRSSLLVVIPYNANTRGLIIPDFHRWGRG